MEPGLLTLLANYVPLALGLNKADIVEGHNSHVHLHTVLMTGPFSPTTQKSVGRNDYGFI